MDLHHSLSKHRMPHTVVLQAILGGQSTRKNMSCAAEGHCTRLEHMIACLCVFKRSQEIIRSRSRVRASVVVPTLI